MQGVNNFIMDLSIIFIPDSLVLCLYRWLQVSSMSIDTDWHDTLNRGKYQLWSYVLSMGISRIETIVWSIGWGIVVVVDG